MDKLNEFRQELASMKEEVRNLLNQYKIEEAEQKMNEVRSLERKIKLQEELEDEEKRSLDSRMESKTLGNDTLDIRSIFVKVLKGKATPEERALVTDVGEDGGYLVPKVLHDQIGEAKRQYKSAKELVGVIPTTSKTGSFVIEKFASVTDLVNFDDDNEGLAEQNPKFHSVEYTIKNYGALIPISNSLLQDEAVNLMNYIINHFSKKAIRTENKKIFEALKAGKTAQEVADLKALKRLVNKGLDPAIRSNAVIITNQDGFSFFDELEDTNGRPLLQPNPADPTQFMLLGLPVHVFSNAELPTTGTSTKKAPVFVGDFVEAVKFFDREVYEVAFSRDAGFTQNLVVSRVIERFDIQVADTDAYVHAAVVIDNGS